MYSNVLQRRKSSARRLSGGVPDRWLVPCDSLMAHCVPAGDRFHRPCAAI